MKMNKFLNMIMLISCFIDLKVQAATYTLNSCHVYAGQTVTINSADTVHIPDGCLIDRGATVNNYGKLIIQGYNFTISGMLNNYGNINFVGGSFLLTNGVASKFVNRGTIDSSAVSFHLYNKSTFDNYGSLIVRILPSAGGGDLLISNNFNNYQSGVIWYQSILTLYPISQTFYNWGKVYSF